MQKLYAFRVQNVSFYIAYAADAGFYVLCKDNPILGPCDSVHRLMDTIALGETPQTAQLSWRLPDWDRLPMPGERRRAAHPYHGPHRWRPATKPG
jgi:hypothetical protein